MGSLLVNLFAISKKNSSFSSIKQIKYTTAPVNTTIKVLIILGSRILPNIKQGTNIIIPEIRYLIELFKISRSGTFFLIKQNIIIATTVSAAMVAIAAP